MAGVWLRARCELRTRLPSTLVLAVLIAIVGGLTMGLAVGTRRTATAPGRLNASLDGRIDVQILDLKKVSLDDIDEIPIVERAAVSRFLVSDEEFDLTTSTDQTFAQQLVDGEVDAEDPLTAVLDGTTARLLDVGVGDHVDLDLYSAAQWEAQDPNGGPQGPHVSVRIAGLIREPDDLDATDPRAAASLGTNGTFALPASFLERFGDETGVFTNVFASVQLHNGQADVAAFKREVRRLPGGDDLEFLDAEETQNQVAARRVVRVQAVGLGLLAATLALVAAATVGQLLVRNLRAEASDASTLRALGMTSGERARVGLVRGLVLGVLSAPLAIGVAIASSWYTPVGVARQGEPKPGLEVNVAWLAVGGLAIVLLVATAATLSAGRSAQTALDDSAPEGARPSGSIVGFARRHAGPVLGSALALSFGTRASRLASRAAIVALTTAIVTLVGGLVMTASFDRVTEDPERYGWTFDAVAGNPYEQDPGDLFDNIEHTPGIESSARAAGVTLEVEGRSLALLAVEPKRGFELRSPRGQLPTKPGEIALGSRTLDELHTSIGSTVAVDAGAGPLDLTVTGTVVVPEVTGLGTGLGEGGVLTLDALTRLDPNAQAHLALLRFRPGQRARAIQAFTDLSEDVQPLAEPYLPSSLYQFVRVRAAFALLGGLVVVLAVATLLHSIVGKRQHRRRDQAVLPGAGLHEGQVTASALSHAATCTAVALVLGLPVGIAAGRLAWTALGDRLGLPDSPAAPATLLVALVPVALVLVLALVAGPGWWVARPAPARLTGRE
ncbi:MAG: FtsX-like permease family protein [Acidimicrobiales bacterium]